jgi:kynurenine formamidase
VKTGKVFAMGIPLNNQGPQSGLFGGRWNLIHTMLATGTDSVAGRFDQGGQTLRYADDALNMPVQAATHWDSLGHIFLDDEMYNGHDARRVDSGGVHVLGIEHARAKMVGRGVLLDVPRHKGVQWLPDGYGISNAELDAVAAVQGVEIRRGDFVIVRTGQLERCRAEGAWGGYAGGDAPGVRFENCYWCQEKQLAAICSDTWGVEVRPNETDQAKQPWHWVVIPAMGLTMGEMFDVSELAADCAVDKVYEFLFSGPPLNLTGGTGSPLSSAVEVGHLHDDQFSDGSREGAFMSDCSEVTQPSFGDWRTVQQHGVEVKNAAALPDDALREQLRVRRGGVGVWNSSH